MAAPGTSASLERGDRVPNFILPNYDGRGMMFYDMARGNPGIILVEAEKTPDLDAEIGAVAAARDRVTDAGLEIFVITRRNHKACQAIAHTLDMEAPVLRDAGAQVTASLRAAAFPDGKPPSLFALVYSANQRIIATLATAGDPLIDRAIETIAAEERDLADVPVTEQAPVLLIPNLLTGTDCADLIAHWREGHTEGGVSAYQEGRTIDEQDSRQKKRRDSLIDDDGLRARVMGKIAKRLVAEMTKSFAYQDFVLEPPVVACYDADRQDYFRRHRDNLSPQTASRRFALSLNLNDGYDGGALTFPEYGGQDYVPAAGAGVIFSCAHVHEAHPVTRGERFVLLTFLHDPNRIPHPWSIPEQERG